MRTLIAVIAGLLLGYLVVFAIEQVNAMLFLPDGINPMGLEQIKDVVASFPATAFILLLVGWFLGTLVGSWVAGRIARNGKRIAGYLVAALLLIATVSNFFILPHPVWVMVAGVIVVLLGGFLGSKAGAKASV